MFCYKWFLWHIKRQSETSLSLNFCGKELPEVAPTLKTFESDSVLFTVVFQCGWSIWFKVNMFLDDFRKNGLIKNEKRFLTHSDVVKQLEINCTIKINSLFDFLFLSVLLNNSVTSYFFLLILSSFFWTYLVYFFPLPSFSLFFLLNSILWMHIL